MLLALAVVTAVAAGGGWFAQRLGQPAVVGQVTAGILLGSGLPGSWSDIPFSAGSRPLLQLLATLGIVVFMFQVGLGVDARQLRAHQVAAGGVAVLGTAIPFALGFVLAFALYPSLQVPTQFLPFALFLGVAMSITAFPVLAAILRHRHIDRTPLGVLVLASAAGDDLLTWATLALAVSIASETTPVGSFLVVAGTAALGLTLAVVVRPALGRLRGRSLDTTAVSISLCGLLLCSSFTAAIGAHDLRCFPLRGGVPSGPSRRTVERRA